MLLRFILSFLLLLSPAAAFAQTPQDTLEGTWAFQIEDAVIFRFAITEGTGGEWHGVWTRPASFGSNGEMFGALSGSETLESMAGLNFAGLIELSFDDPRPGAIPDIFRFRLLGDGQAQLTYVGTDLAPYPLIRVAPDTPLGPFEKGRIYHRRDAATAVSRVPQEQPSNRIGDDFLNGL